MRTDAESGGEAMCAGRPDKVECFDPVVAGDRFCASFRAWWNAETTTARKGMWRGVRRWIVALAIVAVMWIGCASIGGSRGGVLGVVSLFVIPLIVEPGEWL